MTNIQNSSEPELFSQIENTSTTVVAENTTIPFIESATVAAVESTLTFSLYLPPITNTLPIKNITIEDVYYMIKNEGYKKVTEKIRMVTEDEGNAIKCSNLPYVTVSGTFTSRATANMITYNGYITVDLDDNVIQWKDTLAGDTFLNPVLIFISPRGHGLKMVIKVDNANVEAHASYWAAIKTYLQDTYSLTIDKGDDIARACFLCHDPEVFYSESGSIESDVLLSILPAMETEEMTALPSEDAVKMPDPLPIDEPPLATIPDSFLRPSEQLNRLPAIDQRARSALINHGCTVNGEKVTRPGKDPKAGISAIMNVDQKDGLLKFTNFSSNFKPFDVKGYTSVQVICQLEYNGDWDTCIKELAGQHLTQRLTKKKTALLPETPPLPIDGMPKFYQEYIKTCSKVYGTHQDYHAGGAIMAVALGIGSNIELLDKYENVPILWLANIGSVSTGKTKPQELSMGVFERLDIEAYHNWIQAMHLYDALEAKERRQQRILPPEMFQYIVKDITPEKLQKVHSINQRGVMYSVDEFIGLIHNFNKYCQSGEESQLLSSYSQVTLYYSRKGGGIDSNIVIEKPCILLYGGIQPNILPELAKGSRSENGFLSRMCNIWPDDPPLPDYSEETISAELLTRWEQHITRLINLTKRKITLSSEAKKVYISWYNRNQDITRDEQSEHLIGVYQKLNYFVLRLAVVVYGMYLSTGERVTAEVEASVMQAAIEITEYFRATALKVNHKLFSQRSDADRRKDVIVCLAGLGHSQNKISDLLRVSQPYVNKVLKAQ